MNSKRFYINTTKEIDIIRIGFDVRRLLKDAGWKDGLVSLSSPDAGLMLILLPPESKNLEDLKTRIKSDPLQAALYGASCFSVPVENGLFFVEPWQDLYAVDYSDSGKRREIRVFFVSGETETSPQKVDIGRIG